MSNIENVIPHQWKKGQSGNPNGRPRKVITQLKEIGYSKSEVNDTIQKMLTLRVDELKQIYTSPDSTVLEKTISNALYKELQKGSLRAIETLLTRIFGQPKQEIENKVDLLSRPDWLNAAK